MRIAVIAHALKAGGGISVGRNILISFSKVALEHSYLFVVPANAGYENLDFSALDCRVVFFEKKARYLDRWIFDQFKLPRHIQDFRPDVLLGLGNRGMTTPPCAQAVLCQNAHLFYPWKHFGKETLFNHFVSNYNKWVFRRCLRRTDLLFCQTPVAESRLRKMYAFSGSIAQLPNAISVDSLKGDDNKAVPIALQSRGHLLKLFCLARYYPHKNLEMIVQMFAKFRHELKDVLVILTMASTDHPNAKKLLHSIDKLELGPYFSIVGPLEQHELSGYYHHCQALFLPTLLESFSATYLEAMTFGCPILTSDLDFSHHICGDAALYFDPWDVESMKNAILRLKNNPDLTCQLIAKGRERLGNSYETWDEIVVNLCEQLRFITHGHERRDIQSSVGTGHTDG